MKLALLAFLFLLLNSSTADDVVLDSKGESLQSGGNYYMRYFLWPGPGGFTLANTGNNKTCPVDVSTVPCCLNCIPPIDNCDGQALQFSPQAKIGVVKTNHRLSIAFAKTRSCAQSPEWILVKEEGAWLVGIGGPENHPGKKILTGWFILEGSRGMYRLKFCPKLIDSMCGYLEFYNDANQNVRLALRDSTSAMFIFPKAYEESSVI
ncbi:hypothetical protein K1719_031844 [Acacia pycnantha]|nr:hypothetical protein K1719_031844 [Acacia pycnantha]